MTVKISTSISAENRLKLKQIRQARRDEQRRQAIELIKLALQDPLIVGLGAMVLNESAYRAGLYEPGPGEKEQSDLGGPVWFHVGTPLPPAQSKRNMINAVIIGVTTARAIAPVMPAIIQSGSTVAKALAATA